mgnify:CR=1 FL=1
MTAKDKAKELIQLFYNKQCSHSITELAYKSAKQSALICVDEIINTYPTPWSSLDIDPQKEYWTKVKQEINKSDKKQLTLTDVVSTFICDTCKDKGSIAYWHKTGMGIKPCKCRKTN